MSNTHLSSFARLLATEAIRVQHLKDAETASFDVKNRVLTLPRWTNMSNELYDMLIGHEVAHALFTDNTIDEDRGCLKACSDIGGDDHGSVLPILNIVEDARIERLIKGRYPGLKRDFVVGYRWIWDAELFPIEELGGLSKMTLMDRLNVHYKVGLFGIVNVPFTDEEQVWVDRMGETETWEDVIDLARDLYESGAATKDLKGEEVKVPTESGRGVMVDGDGDQETQQFSPIATDNLGKKITERFQPGSYDTSVLPSTMPTPVIEKILVPVEKVQQDFDTPKYAYTDEETYYNTSRQRLRQQFEEWVASESSTINYLAKQFEMRKAADEHQRTLITKSGRLDTVKMIDYRWSEDIFAKNHIVQDGKNHGFMFLLDWSGSMVQVLVPVVKQTILLSLFCHQCNIPFEILAFCDSHPTHGYAGSHYFNTNSSYADPRETYWTDENLLPGEEDRKACGYVQMLQFAKSGVRRKDLMDHLFNLWYVAHCEGVVLKGDHRGPRNIEYHKGYRLCGTPLNEALVFAHHYLPKFRRRHNVQILNTVILSDGDSNWSNFNPVIFNPITKTTYGLNDCERGICATNQLVRSLQDTTGCNVIGIHLGDRGHNGGWVDEVKGLSRSDDNYWTRRDEMKKIFRKKITADGWCLADSVKATYYTEAYVINASIEPDEDLILKDDNHAALKRSFVKGMAKRAMSRTLINRFIDKVA